MLNNLEILDFFKNFPKQVRTKCIEEVLIYGIRAIKNNYSGEISLPILLKINESKIFKNSKDFTPKFKESIKKEIIQDTDRLRLNTLRGVKENVCPDTTCLPLKIENRRAQSTQLQCSEYKRLSNCDKNSVKKPNQMNESLEKESEIIRLADEFLKNPFARTIFRHKPQTSSPGLFLDSNIFSTIEIASPSLYKSIFDI